MQAPAIGLTGTFSSPRHRLRALEFSVGSSYPCPISSIHGFADMIVLSRSFYRSLALQHHVEDFDETPQVLRNIRFQSPLILSDQDFVIQANVDRKGNGCADYVFLDPGSREISAERALPLAELGVSSAGLTHCEKSFSPNDFKSRANLVGDAKAFYRKLRQNGNQYGLRFQKVSAVWRSGNEVMGEVAVPSDPSQTERYFLHPILLDSITQVLAAFRIENDKTYILKSIDRIEIRERNFPEAFWVRATRHPGSEGDTGELTGDIDVFDESGKCFWNSAVWFLPIWTVLRPLRRNPQTSLKFASLLPSPLSPSKTRSDFGAITSAFRLEFVSRRTIKFFSSC